MNRRRISSHSAYTWVELIVVVVVLAVLLALLPCVLSDTGWRVRRAVCTNNLKAIALGLHNYAQPHKVFPPGAACSRANIIAGQADPWADALLSSKGASGTSWLQSTLPYIECGPLDRWDAHYSVTGGPNQAMASMDIRSFYCPTRRNRLRRGDNAMLLSAAWTGGGTDYGGCAGRHAAFTLETSYNVCDATMYYEPGFFPKPFKDKKDDTPQKRWGIFGRVNVSTTWKEVRDGLSNTIATGELQRITDITPGSKDGWAVGGPSTLFTTGALVRRNGTTVTYAMPSNGGRLMNNSFFGSPGSEHSNGANFGMADGSVHFLSDTIDPNIFAELGSMADGVPPPDGNN
jgi:prepilin-type processing-associated H-X9-DG protein